MAVPMQLKNLTAMVVGLNEANLLKSCLNSIQFCGKILYFDLGSVDDSVKIADALGAHVTLTEKVPYGEFVRAKNISKVETDWILITDPDEYLDPKLSETIVTNWNEYATRPQLGGIRAPIQYYFKNKPLLGTPWGGENSRLLLLRKEAFEFTETVHGGEKLNPGFNIQLLPDSAGIVHHYWSDSYMTLIKKHLKYLQHEADKLDPDRPIKLWKILVSPGYEMFYSYFLKKGYKDGITGLLLSLIWSWYNTAARYVVWRAAYRPFYQSDS